MKWIWLSIFMVLFMMESISVFAKQKQSYVIDSEGERVTIPLVYEVTAEMISFPLEIDTLEEPEDLCVGKDDSLYILDSGHSRIIKYRKDGSFDCEIKPKKTSISEAQGIFVDQRDRIFVADTKRQRILILDQKGEVEKELTQPKDVLYDQDYPFEPIKIGTNSLGQIYVINQYDYHGFCILNEDNQFQGYFATNQVNRNVLDEWITRFASQSQKEQKGKRIPARHTNFMMAEDGSIYVTTANVTTEQVKRMSSIGSNFYPYKGSFGDNTVDYLTVLQGKKETAKEFVDVCADSAGIISALDQTSGKIYQYDDTGVMLCAFGGTGNWSGSMMDAVAMAQDSAGRIYVLDRSSKEVQCFSPTDFTQKVHQALTLYQEGDYDQVKSIWKDILTMSPNYAPALIGLANVEVKEKNYVEAMEDYKAAGDKSGYGKAFLLYQKEWIQTHFLLFSLIVLMFLFALGVCFKELKETTFVFRHGYNESCSGMQMIQLMLFAPWEAGGYIKNRKSSFDWRTPTLLLLAGIVINVVRLLLLNYPASTTNLKSQSMMIQVSGFVIPLVLIVLGIYFVQSIFEGETSLKETYGMVCYGMTPYVVFTIPCALLTNMMGSNGAGFFNLATKLIWIWVILLIFISVKVMNHYSFKRTVVVLLVSVVATLFLAIIITLLYSLGIKLLTFVFEVIAECRRII